MHHQMHKDKMTHSYGRYNQSNLDERHPDKVTRVYPIYHLRNIFCAFYDGIYRYP